MFNMEKCFRNKIIIIIIIIIIIYTDIDFVMCQIAKISQCDFDSQTNLLYIQRVVKACP